MKRKTISVHEDVFKQLSTVKDTLSRTQGRELTWNEMVASLADIGERSQGIANVANAWLSRVSSLQQIRRNEVEKVVWRRIRGQSVWGIRRATAIPWRKVRVICQQLEGLDEATFGRVLFSVFVGKSADVQAAYAKLGEPEPPAPGDEPQVAMPASLSQRAFATIDKPRGVWEGQAADPEESP